MSEFWHRERVAIKIDFFFDIDSNLNLQEIGVAVCGSVSHTLAGKDEEGW